MEHYRINVYDQSYMRSGTWLELRARIFALIARPYSHDLTGHPVFTSALQAALFPPTGGSS